LYSTNDHENETPDHEEIAYFWATKKKEKS